MRAAVIIAAKDLRQRLRDRSALVLGVGAPLVIAALISLAFGGAQSFRATIGVVDRDHGPVAQAFVRFLNRAELRAVVRTRTIVTEADARRQVRAGRTATAVVIPAGFSTAAQGGRAVPLTVLSSVDNRLASQVAVALADGFVGHLNADRLAVAATIAGGVPQSEAGRLAAEAAHLELPENVTVRPAGTRPMKAISYYAPGMAMLFLFFAIGFGARSYFTEQEGGTLDRIAAAPLRPLSILAGKALSVFVYGVSSMAVVVVVTTAAFGARWGSPVATGLLVVAVVVAVVCLTALVITVARTPRQAEGLASMLVFGLALLGGNFVFISAAPKMVRRLALLTPNGWALRGFVDLSTGSGGVGSVVTPVLAILAFSVVVGGVAAARSRGLVQR